MKLADTKNKKETDFECYQQKVKVIEDRYYEEVALLIDYEAEAEGNPDDKLKKKKKKKTRIKKKNSKTDELRWGRPIHRNQNTHTCKK